MRVRNKATKRRIDVWSVIRWPTSHKVRDPKCWFVVEESWFVCENQSFHMYILANLELQRLKAKRNFPNTQKECRYNFNNQETLFCIGKLLKTPNKKHMALHLLRIWFVQPIWYKMCWMNWKLIGFHGLLGFERCYLGSLIQQESWGWEVCFWGMWTGGMDWNIVCAWIKVVSLSEMLCKRHVFGETSKKCLSFFCWGFFLSRKDCGKMISEIWPVAFFFQNGRWNKNINWLVKT